MLIWLVMLRTQYEQMPAVKRSRILFNAGIDATILMFLVAAIYVGFTRDSNTFVFWVPFTLFAVYVRAKQARERWKS